MTDHRWDWWARPDDGEWELVASGLRDRYAPLPEHVLEGKDWLNFTIHGHDAPEGFLRSDVRVTDYYPWGEPAPDAPPGGALEDQHILLEWQDGRTTLRCWESQIEHISLCGRNLTGEAERVVYKPPMDPDEPHASLCFDCTTVAAGGEVEPKRRELHF